MTNDRTYIGLIVPIWLDACDAIIKAVQSSPEKTIILTPPEDDEEGYTMSVSYTDDDGYPCRAEVEKIYTDKEGTFVQGENLTNGDSIDILLGDLDIQDVLHLADYMKLKPSNVEPTIDRKSLCDFVKFMFIMSSLDESEKMQLDNLDFARLTYDETGNVVVENEHGSTFAVDELNEGELKLFYFALYNKEK